MNLKEINNKLLNKLDEHSKTKDDIKTTNKKHVCTLSRTRNTCTRHKNVALTSSKTVEPIEKHNIPARSSSINISK